MEGDDGTAGLAWTLWLAIAWPIASVAAFHLAWGPTPTGAQPSILGIALLLAAPGGLAIAAADESPRWRRIIGAAVATTSAFAIVAYGMLTLDTVGCGERGTPAEIAVTMLPSALIVAVGAGLTAWQGGRLVVAFRRVGIPLAFLLGWAMLLVALGAAVSRAFSVGCFGY